MASIAAGGRGGDVAARYNRVAMTFHWAIAALIVVNVVIGLFGDAFPAELRGSSMGYHKAAGITVLFLSLGRLAWRLMNPPPPFSSHLKRWERWLASATHHLFYVLMIGVPLAGWLYVSAATKPRPLTFFGLFDIPFLPVARTEAGAGLFNEVHEVLAFVTIGLLLLHVAGALKHQFIDRDNELGRMVPGMAPGGAATDLESPVR